MSDTEDRENSPVSNQEEDEDVKKTESGDEGANHDASGDAEPSPTKSESSAEAADITESVTKKPTPKKKKQPEKKEEVEEQEKDEEESDGEPKLGLLERPVVIESGKRQKKKVERLDISGNATPKEKKKLEFGDGAGLKLGDCPRIEFQLQRNKAEDLKMLHRYLFGRIVAANVVKKNIRQFNGFSFEKGDKEYDKKSVFLYKYTNATLKHFCTVLDLERQGTKEDVMERLMTFCMAPADSGKRARQPKKRRGPAGKKEKGATGEKRKRATKKEMNAKKTKEDEDDDESAEDSEEEEEKEEKEEEEKESDKSESEEESEEEAPKKKKRKVEAPKKPPPKEKKARKPAAKKEIKKPKPPPKKVVAVSDSDSDDSDDSDDEPLQKKAKPSPPTNDDLKTLVKKILDKANLEEVTMKSVIKEVYGKYPDFDLSDRKDYIKKTVKQLIT